MNAQVTPETIEVPLKAPSCIPSEFDDELFALCRADDYRGLYEALVRIVVKSKVAYG